MAKYTLKDIKKVFHNEEPWVNIFIFSHITIPLSYIVANYTKITPNIISIMSLLLGVLSAVLYANHLIIAGALSYTFSYILDAIDGKIARLTNTGKPYGAWFDIFVDRINLTLITTAISYNVFIETNEVKQLILNNLFLGLAFIGWESRYNITIYKIKNNIIENSNNAGLSRYTQWRKKYNLIKEPISLPEIFLFYMIIAPIFHLEFIAVIIGIIFLIIRIIKQQKFWINVNKNK